jgi:hypothetical protein
MSTIEDEAIIHHLWALRVSTLTTDLARNLEAVLSNLPGVEAFSIILETQELHIRLVLPVDAAMTRAVSRIKSGGKLVMGAAHSGVKPAR